MIKKNLLLLALLACPLLTSAQSLHVGSDKKGRLGYFDENDKEVIKCQFDEAEPFVNGYARVLKDDDYGIINEKGKFVSGKYSVMTEYAETEYYLVADGGSEIDAPKPGKEEKPIKSRAGISPQVFKGSMMFPIKGAKWGVIDRNGKELIEVEYDEVSYPINGVIYVSQGGKIGFYDLKMHLVLKPTYTFMGAFNQHGITWVKQGGKSGGIFKAIAGVATSAVGGVFGGRMGIIDRQGKLIVPLIYKYVSTFMPSFDPEFSSAEPAAFSPVPFSELPNCDGENYIWAASKFKKDLAVYDLSGRPVPALGKYDKVYRPTEGMMRFYRAGKKKIPDTWGFCNLKTGEELVTNSSYSYGPFSGGLSKVWLKNNGKEYFFVDKSLQEMSKHYDYAYDFNEGLSVVKKNDLFGVIDQSGRELISPVFAQMSGRFSEGVVAAAIEPKDDRNFSELLSSSVFLAQAGVVPTSIADMQDLEGGIRGGGRLVCGYINAAGQVVIPFEYSAAGDFHGGRALVSKQGNIGIVGIDASTVLPAEWQEVKYPRSTLLLSDYFWVKQEGLYYYYDMKRQAVGFPEQASGYNEVTFFNDRGFAIVRRGGTKDRSETTQTGEGHDWSTLDKAGNISDILKASAKIQEKMLSSRFEQNWESNGEVYGAVNREGNEFIPCSFEFKNVDRAWQYMKKNELEYFRDVDLKRLGIILHGTSNTHRLSDIVPSNEWDY